MATEQETGEDDLAANDHDARDDDDEADDDAKPPLTVSVTTEGLALVPAGRQVLLVDLEEGGDTPEWLREGIEDGSVPYQVLNRLYGFTRRGGVGTGLGAGDLTGVRKVRDAAGWRVETLGRDGEYGSMVFASETAAADVIALFERMEIVQRPLDDERQPIPASAEDFEEARRLAEQTERELAIAPDDDEPPPSQDYSTRR